MKRTFRSLHPLLFSTALAVGWAALVGSVPGAEAPPAETNDVKLPTAKEVIAKSVKACGGAEAWQKHRSMHIKGSVAMPAQGIKGDMEVFLAAPSNHLAIMDIPNLGKVQTGCDGEVAWSIDPVMGPRLLTGKELEQLLAESDYNGALHEEKKYKSMETVAETPFDGRPCYKVKLVRLSGEEVIEYFDKATGLSAGSTLKQESPMGLLPVTQVTTDYKKFGDLLLPTKTTQKVMGIEQVVTFDSIEFDQVKDTAFELPAKIKALLKK